MRIAFPTDEHYPFQDERARQIALEIVRDFRPDLLIAGSDGLDFYDISSFDKNPARAKVGLQAEIDLWRVGQHEWKDAAPGARRLFLPGNHEDRLRRYLWRHPELALLEAMQLPNLLGLRELGVDYLPGAGSEIGTEYAIGETLVIKHGKTVRRFAGMSARAELEAERYSISTLTGHSHRGGVIHARTRQGLVAACEGYCLCSLEPEYVTRPDWQQGIVLVEVNGSAVMFEAVPFFDQRLRKVAFFREKEYAA